MISSTGLGGSVGVTSFGGFGGTGGGFVGGGVGNSSGGGFFNQSLANGSFRSGALYGKGSITALYAEGQIRAQWNITKGNINVGVFGKFSLLNANGEIGIGDSNFGIALKGVVDVGTLTAFAGLKISPEKDTYFVGVELGAIAVSGRAGVQLTLFGTPIEVGVQGEIGAKVAFGVEFKNGELKINAGATLIFGGQTYIRIKFW